MSRPIVLTGGRLLDPSRNIDADGDLVIVAGKIEAYYKDVALVHQAWVREPKKTIGELIKEASAKVGENIQVRRFVRFQMGEE